MIEMKDTRLQAIGKHASEIERKLKEKYTFTDVDIRTEHHEPDELIIENETIHSFCFILTDMSSDEEIKHTRQLCLEKKEKGCWCFVISVNDEIVEDKTIKENAKSFVTVASDAFCAARRSLMRYQRSDGVPAVGPRSGLLASCDCHVVVFCHPLEKRV